MLRFGEDFSGAFVLGRESPAAALTATQASVVHSKRGSQYQHLAERALNGDLVGASAGGEQPKFLADTTHPDKIRHVMVKFSPPMSESIGRRWADLLYAEHIASSVLAQNGFAVAKSEVLDAGERRFLEMERFDRLSGGGRMPVISLRAISAALLDGIGSSWPDVANRLHKKIGFCRMMHLNSLPHGNSENSLQTRIFLGCAFELGNGFPRLSQDCRETRKSSWSQREAPRRMTRCQTGIPDVTPQPRHDNAMKSAIELDASNRIVLSRQLRKAAGIPRRQRLMVSASPGRIVMELEPNMAGEVDKGGCCRQNQMMRANSKSVRS
ncbi:MAG: HipA domain-containing protein [Terrimicrobiaceae bacterium]